MSKVIKLLKAYPTGRYTDTPMKYVSAKVTTSNDYRDLDRQIEIRIDATVGAKVWLNDNLKTLLDDTNVAIRDVQRSVIEEMFGEFRPLIRDLYMATYENDPGKIRALLHDLSRDMFEI